MIAIKIHREKAGKTQEQLASEVGVDRSTVAKWDTGVAFPRRDKLTQIALALNCSIAELFADDTCDE